MSVTPIFRGIGLAVGLLVFLKTQAASAPDMSTAQGHLDAVQKAVATAQGHLRTATTNGRGGFVDKARTDIVQVQADIKEAEAYVAAHPESNALLPGPAPLQPPGLHPAEFAHISTFPDLNAALDGLNEARLALLNNMSRDYHGPVLGELGGLREKLLADIIQTAEDIHAAQDYALAHPRNAAKAPAPTPAAPKPAPAVNYANKPLSSAQIKALVLIEGDYSSGSGFVAKIHDQFFIVTNLHVLSGNKKFTITGIDNVKYPTNGTLYGALDRDVAILKIPEELAQNFLELQDDPLTNAPSGDAVTVPGNANGAGVAIQINGKVLGVGPELVEVDAKFVHGNSGSPIIHRASNKVIGVATFTINYKLDDLGKAAQNQNVHWFGVRMDNIGQQQWETLDWKRFSEAGQKIQKVDNVINAMLALLQNQKQPPTDDEQVIACIANYQTSAALAKKRNNDRDFLSAVQTLMQNLQALSKKDLRDLDGIRLDAYHTALLKKQQDLLAEIDKAFAVASKQIGSFKNSL